MVIDTNGNVGIGTTVPLSPLHIEGNSYINGNLLKNNKVKPQMRYASLTLSGGRLCYTNLIYDTHSAVTTGSNWVYTVPSGCSGFYLITCASISNVSTTIELYVNGSYIQRMLEIIPSNNYYMVGSTTIYVIAGNTIYLGTNGSLTYTTNNNYTWITISCLEYA